MKNTEHNEDTMFDHHDDDDEESLAMAEEEEVNPFVQKIDNYRDSMESSTRYEKMRAKVREQMELFGTPNSNDANSILSQGGANIEELEDGKLGNDETTAAEKADDAEDESGTYSFRASGRFDQDIMRTSPKREQTQRRGRRKISSDETDGAERVAMEAFNAARRVQVELDRHDPKYERVECGSTLDDDFEEDDDGDDGGGIWKCKCYLLNRFLECQWRHDGSCSNRRVGRIAFTIGLVMVNLIGIAILARVRHNSESNNGDGHENGVQQAGIDIPPPPSNVKDMCAESNIATSFGRGQCVRACLPAACCTYNKDEKESCIEQNGAICREYEDPCHVLLDENHDTYDEAYPKKKRKRLHVPPASPYLERFCSLTSVSSSSGIIPSLSDQEHCRDLCIPGACCFADESMGMRNCYAENDDNCREYSSCASLPPGELHGVMGGVGLIRAPLNLAQICSTASLRTFEGRSQCESDCNPALCCVGLGGYDCSDLSSTVCETYNACRSSVWSDLAISIVEENVVVDIPNTVEAVCRDHGYGDDGTSAAGAALITSNPHESMCDLVCAAGNCCLSGSCLDGNEFVCDQYQTCPRGAKKNDNLSNSAKPMVHVPNPSTSLAVLCSPTNLFTEKGLKACQKSCAPGACCFASKKYGGGGNCYMDNEDVCSKYEACLGLPNGFINDEVGGPGTGSIPSPLEILCSPTQLQSEKGRMACSEVCSSGSCCFGDGEPGSCLEGNEKKCNAYFPCNALLYVPPPPSNLTEMCSMFVSESVGGGNGLSSSLSTCEYECSKASCCFIEGTSGNCFASNEWQCGQYEVCKTLDSIGGGGGVSAVVYGGPLETKCSEKSLSTPKGYEACRDECEPSRCCLVNGEGSCKVRAHQKCKEYVPFCFEILKGGGGELPGVGVDSVHADDQNDSSAMIFMSPVGEACSKANIETKKTGLAECQAMCSHASCCETQGPFSCLAENKSWCAEVAPYCKILSNYDLSSSASGAAMSNVLGGGEAVPIPPSNLHTICSEERLKTYDGFSECEKLCEDALCCFIVDDSYSNSNGGRSCRETHGDACSKWEICKLLTR